MTKKELNYHLKEKEHISSLPHKNRLKKKRKSKIPYLESSKFERQF